MFFLIRSALCIGLVAAALPNRPDAGGRVVDGLVGAGETSATAALIHYCGLHADRCVSALQAAGAVPASAGARPRRMPGDPASVARGARSPDHPRVTISLERPG